VTRRLMLLVGVALLVGVSVAAAEHPGGPPRSVSGSPAPSAGEIVFTGSAGLYRMSTDGSHRRLFARGGSEAAVSADGRRIAFVRGSEVWVMQRDGSGQRQLTTLRQGSRSSFPLSPAFSSDGRILYFARTLNDPRQELGVAIYSIHTDGTALRRLTNGGCEVAPAPSPDGRLIAYTSMGGMRSLDCVEGRDGSIDAVTPAGRSAHLPFQFPARWTYEPAWSRDGRRLAYTAVNGDSVYLPERLYISAADGSRPRLVTTRGDAFSPAWSTDGNWICFVTKTGISLVRSDGTQLRALTHAKTDADPVWLQAGG
jgi:Tol biopolymer transport system component